MQKAGQLYIPDWDQWFANVFTQTGDKFDYTSLSKALSIVTNWDMAVDGGAHVGSWTRVLADKFKNVMAFELQPENYDCLVKNTKHLSNVSTLLCGLGEEFGMVRVSQGPDNSGQWHISGEGGLAVRPLDQFNIQSLGFLKLDIEGYELKALRGATETIQRCSPVVLIEENGLCERYSISPGEADKYLKSLGYTVQARVNKDYIYCKSSA